MAMLNEILVGRFNRLAQKLLSMKGPAALPQLAGEMRFVLPLFHATENRYLEAWDLFAQQKNVPAQGAGNLPGLMLRNPVGSNVVIVVTLAQEANGAAADTGGVVILRSQTADLAGGTIANVGWDARGRPASTGIVSFGTTPAAASLTIFLGGAANAISSTPPQIEFPVLPGSAFVASGGTPNVTALLSIAWRERFLEDSERA